MRVKKSSTNNLFSGKKLRKRNQIMTLVIMEQLSYHFEVAFDHSEIMIIC